MISIDRKHYLISTHLWWFSESVKLNLGKCQGLNHVYSLQFSVQIGSETYRDAVSASYRVESTSHGIDSCYLMSHITHESLMWFLFALIATKLACLEVFDTKIWLVCQIAYCTKRRALGKQEQLNRVRLKLWTRQTHLPACATAQEQTARHEHHLGLQQWSRYKWQVFITQQLQRDEL